MRSPLRLSIVATATFATAAMLCACFPAGRIRINGKVVEHQDGARAAREYYGPELGRLGKHPTPLATDAVFTAPNAQFALANWVKNKGKLQPKQVAFFRDFTMMSWLSMAQGLRKVAAFRSLENKPTAMGTNDLAQPVAPDTLVVSYTANNKVMVYRAGNKKGAIVITEKLTPGHELEMMSNLVVAAAKRLTAKAPSAAPAKTPVVAAPKSPGPIVAVFSIKTSRLKLKEDLRTSLTAMATAHLAASGRYRVVPHSQIKARLRQQKKASYRSCYDMACQVQLGRELAAQKSLAITISKIGSTCSVSAVLYDLKLAASERAATTSGACGEDGYLASIKGAVDKLSKVSGS